MAGKQQHRERLAHLVKSYGKDFEKPLAEYKKACEEYNVKSPKDFLNDASLYAKQYSLAVSTIVDMIKAETDKVTPKAVLKEKQKKREREREEKREKKRQKFIEKQDPCDKCGAKKGYLFLYAKACDNNSYKLPNGKEGEGYMPSFTGITDSDGVITELCVNCGVPKGFNAQRFQQEIAEAEAEALENNNDDDDDDDD